MLTVLQEAFTTKQDKSKEEAEEEKQPSSSSSSIDIDILEKVMKESYDKEEQNI